MMGGENVFISGQVSVYRRDKTAFLLDNVLRAM